jgi:hypothetical protein
MNPKVNNPMSAWMGGADARPPGVSGDSRSMQGSNTTAKVDGMIRQTLNG